MSIRCINCSLNVTRIRRHILSKESNQFIDTIRRWTYPQHIAPNHYICHSCWELVNYSLNQEQPSPSQIGHRTICIGCGRSILRIRKRLVLRSNNTERDKLTVNVLLEWIRPRQILPADEVCVPCWLKAQRIVDRHSRTSDDSQSVFQEQETIPISNIEEIEMSEPIQAVDELVQEHIEEPFVQAQQRVETGQSAYIVLPNIRRAANTGNRCIFLNCTYHDRFLVPISIRERVIKDFNFYIPPNACICNYHLHSNMYHELYYAKDAMSSFNATQIEEMVFLSQRRPSQLILETQRQ